MHEAHQKQTQRKEIDGDHSCVRVSRQAMLCYAITVEESDHLLSQGLAGVIFCRSVTRG